VLSIQLNNLNFFAHHGLYEEEKIHGNDFEVNAVISYRPAKKVTDLSDTIDYASVYEVIYKRMQIATPLLETIVMELANEILAKFTLADSIAIELTKKRPPIHNFNGTVSVKYELNRNQITD